MVAQKNQQAVDQQQQYDWFSKAMTSQGNVHFCLDQVIKELDYKKRFITALQQLIAEDPQKRLDNLTLLSQRLKIFEDTIKVRLPLLIHDRVAAWFKPSTAIASGPFIATVLTEPIFSHYENDQWESIKTDILKSWSAQLLLGHLSKHAGNSLWKMLLSMNHELENLAKLPAPFEQLRLDHLPEQLPVDLECTSLKRFLFNVKKEYLSVQRRMQNCYEELLQKSEKFWQYQSTLVNEKKKKSPHYNDIADQIREEFKQRREQQRSHTKYTIKLHLDAEYLRFMGFQTSPSRADLKKRYIHLAKKMHPDMGGDAQSFQKLTEAYEYLDQKYAFRFD